MSEASGGWRAPWRQPNTHSATHTPRLDKERARPAPRWRYRASLTVRSDARIRAGKRVFRQPVSERVPQQDRAPRAAHRQRQGPKRRQRWGTTMMLLETWSAVIPFRAQEVSQRSAGSGFEGWYLRARQPETVSGKDLTGAGGSG